MNPGKKIRTFYTLNLGKDTEFCDLPSSDKKAETPCQMLLTQSSEPKNTRRMSFSLQLAVHSCIIYNEREGKKL